MTWMYLMTDSNGGPTDRGWRGAKMVISDSEGNTLTRKGAIGLLAPAIDPGMYFDDERFDRFGKSIVGRG